jgi:hypothetical protein
MNELLSDIVRAHGGFGRWRALNHVTATIVTGGDLWAMKGLAPDPLPQRVTIDLHQQRAVLTPFGDAAWHADFAPDRIAILRGDGSVVMERTNSRAAFADHEMHTPWDPLHQAYFTCYALSLYLTTPFLLAQEDVRVHEIEPWVEGDETWSVLRAEFAEPIATHSQVQNFYFGDDLLLRRHDYDVDVAGGFAAAQLVDDYIIADGIRLPRRRRTFLRKSDRKPDLGALMVAIDIKDAQFS